ncbi:hypothetical protein EVG20_g980 [Dentipellis fragilis]|uniref:Uncharacterized protein n=1 Tax=Dentipellis fragilis TaxID=205917 RepID=A0A4Y9ZE04_9AGAM|nr:hypothetical protein EVG20_g980 [Dentipellis fragilis]
MFVKLWESHHSLSNARHLHQHWRAVAATRLRLSSAHEPHQHVSTHPCALSLVSSFLVHALAHLRSAPVLTRPYMSPALVLVRTLPFSPFSLCDRLHALAHLSRTSLVAPFTCPCSCNSRALAFDSSRTRTRTRAPAHPTSSCPCPLVRAASWSFPWHCPLVPLTFLTLSLALAPRSQFLSHPPPCAPLWHAFSLPRALGSSSVPSRYLHVLVLHSRALPALSHTFSLLSMRILLFSRVLVGGGDHGREKTEEVVGMSRRGRGREAGEAAAVAGKRGAFGTLSLGSQIVCASKSFLQVATESGDDVDDGRVVPTAPETAPSSRARPTPG